MTPQIEFDCGVCGTHIRVSDYQAPGSTLPDCCLTSLRKIAHEVGMAVIAVSVSKFGTIFTQKLSDALVTHPDPEVRKAAFQVRNRRKTT